MLRPYVDIMILPFSRRFPRLLAPLLAAALAVEVLFYRPLVDEEALSRLPYRETHLLKLLLTYHDTTTHSQNPTKKLLIPDARIA
jgi:hypothetical protein